MVLKSTSFYWDIFNVKLNILAIAALKMSVLFFKHYMFSNFGIMIVGDRNEGWLLRVVLELSIV